MDPSSGVLNGTEVLSGTKGQSVCRNAVWSDVLKFFLFNYGLHVFTVLAAPGSGRVTRFVNAVTAVLLPYSGIVTAASIMYHFARGESDELQAAHKAGALCMVVPTRLATKEGFANRVNLRSTEIHGQYPDRVTTSKSKLAIYDNESNRPPAKWRIVVVPPNFTVNTLINAGSTEMLLSCNFSILQAVAAILQIVYSSLELYEASARQIPKYGYASYSLTVLPYVIMSLTNLLATICEPQYPTMFLVIYRGLEKGPDASVDGSGQGPTTEPKPSSAMLVDSTQLSPEELEEPQAEIIGAIGEAYGDLDPPPGTLKSKKKVRSGLRRAMFAVLRVFAVLLGMFSFALPYIIIYLLTNFESRESTLSQRIWITLWIAGGQVYGLVLCPLVFGSDRTAAGRILFNTIYGGSGARVIFLVLLPGAVAIGGYVVVAQTMLTDDVCVIV